MKNGFCLVENIDNIGVDELTFKTILEGKRMRNSKDFHAEIERKLELPDYYGKNWHALGEIINDLSWLDFNDFVFLIRDYDLVLSEEATEQKSEFLCIFENAMAEWENVPNYEGEDEYREVSSFLVIAEKNTQLKRDLEALELDDRMITK
jgi:RNAse (barnase) inhibitor barstar